MIPRLDERFWTSTRGRIVLLLLQGRHTVNELADALGLTDNAVRAHLVALERDRLVTPTGRRPGRRRPNIVYALTPDAEQLFPKVYGLIFRSFLDVLKERMSAKKLDELVRAVGQRLAPAYRSAVPAMGQKCLDQAVAILRDLGGFCKAEIGNGSLHGLRCFECPLAMAVVGHPEICRLMETLLAGALGVPVRQRCQTEPTPHCYFEIEADAG